MNTLTRIAGIGLVIIVLLTPPAMALNKTEILTDIQSRAGTPSLLDFVRGEVPSYIFERVFEPSPTSDQQTSGEPRLSIRYSRSEGLSPSDRINLGNLPPPGITSPPYVPVGEVNYIQGLYMYSGECYGIAIDESGTSFVFQEPVRWVDVRV